MKRQNKFLLSDITKEHIDKLLHIIGYTNSKVVDSKFTYRRNFYNSKGEDSLLKDCSSLCLVEFSESNGYYFYMLTPQGKKYLEEVTQTKIFVPMTKTY